MRLFKSIKSGFSNYFSTSGTATRGDFWFWLMFVCILLCITLIIDGAYMGPIIAGFFGEEVMAFDQNTPRWLSRFTLLSLAIPTVTVTMRRIQDGGHSKWWILLAPTVLGLVPLLYFLVKKGRKTSAQSPS